MSAVFVRDNYDKANWGGRATSTALRQIIAARHRVDMSVPASVFARRYRLPESMPAGAFDLLCGKLYRRPLLRLPVTGAAISKVVRWFGQPEPLNHDIERNARRLVELARYYPKLAEVIAAIDRADDLMINLEGDGIFTREPRHTFVMTLSLAELAIQRGKRVHMLNGMFSAQPDGLINSDTVDAAAAVLRRCATIVLREDSSQAFAQKHFPGIATHVRPDALFAWKSWIGFADDLSNGPDRSHLSIYFDQSNVPMPEALAGRYIVVGGSSAAAWSPRRAAPAYCALINGLKSLGLPIVVVQTCQGDAFLAESAREAGVAFLPALTPIAAAVATLGNAQCFVSGRWHPSIMASLNGTPSVFLGSNSHKTLSLQHQLGYLDPVEYPAIPTSTDVEAIVARTGDIMADAAASRARIRKRVERLEEEALSVAELI